MESEDKEFNLVDFERNCAEDGSMLLWPKEDIVHTANTYGVISQGTKEDIVDRICSHLGVNKRKYPRDTKEESDADSKENNILSPLPKNIKKD